MLHGITSIIWDNQGLFYDSMEPMGEEFYWCKLYIALSVIGIMQKRRAKFVSNIVLLDKGKIVINCYK